MRPERGVYEGMRAAFLLALLTLAACASGPPPLPPDLLSRLDSELKALPPGAEDLFYMEDAERMAQLRESGRGTPEDQEFLEKRILGEQIPRVKRDLARVARPAPPKPSEPRHRVTMKDGRTIDAVLLERTPEAVRLKVRLGTILIPMESVADIQPLPE